MSLTNYEKEQLFKANRFFRRVDLHRNVLEQILVDRHGAHLQPGRPFLVSHRYLACMLGVERAGSLRKRLAINQHATRIMRELVEIGVLRRYGSIRFAYHMMLPVELMTQAVAVDPKVVDLLRISSIVFMLLRVAAYNDIAEARTCLRQCLPNAGTGAVTPGSLYGDLGTSESALCRDLKPARDAGLVILAPISSDRRRHEYCFPYDLESVRVSGGCSGPQLASLISNYLLVTNEIRR